MKKLFSFLIIAAVITSCGGKDSKSLAQEVCDCYKKANSMAITDTSRTNAQNDCVKKQGEAWNKVKDDPKRSEEYNKIVGACGKEMIKNSLGQ